MWLRLLFLLPFVHCSIWNELNLPPILLEYHIRSTKSLKEKCLSDVSCPIEKNIASSDRCWGYEIGCAFNRSYTAQVGIAKCNLHTDRPISIEASRVFFDQGDFGYLKNRQILHTICESKEITRSSLKCSDSLQYCYGKNIFFDFRKFDATHSTRYRNDIVHEGEVGGNCEKIYPEVIKAHLTAKSYLQSWGHELEYFASYSEYETSESNCDIIFERPTILMKLDASINMYHHFCDFVNLYASLHINGSFHQNVDIVWWDTFSGGFIDKFFGTTWEAFSKNKPTELISLAGKRVCFKDVMLPLLARQRFGLFYNMPLTHGCSGSGFIQSFATFILHRLEVKQTGPDLKKLRVTILQRSTTYRKILNIDEIVEVARKVPDVEVNVVDYNPQMPFKLQLETTYNSDIFIGMHGSGLTHLLFLPDWAAVMEIYHCDDPTCYYDLARLRGVKYFTWPKGKEHLIEPDKVQIHPTLGKPHKKFANYRFDPIEFQKNLEKMAEFVRRHPMFLSERRAIRRALRKGEL